MTEREELCLRVFEESSQPERVKNHCRAVALVSEALALALNAIGFSLDVSLCRRAGLLHDIMRTEPKHSFKGRDFLLSLGLVEEAEITGLHMGEGIDPLSINEASVVCLADKITAGAGKRVSVEQRFAPGIEKFRDNPELMPSILLRLETCKMLEDYVQSLLGFPLSQLPLPHV